MYEANNVVWKVTLGACSGLCCRTVWRTCILLGFLAFDNSLKITNFTMVPRLSLWAFRSSLQSMKNTKRYIKSKKHLDFTWGVTVHVLILNIFGSVRMCTEWIQCCFNHCMWGTSLHAESNFKLKWFPPRMGQYHLYQYTLMLQRHRVSCYWRSARSKYIRTEPSLVCTATLLEFKLLTYNFVENNPRVQVWRCNADLTHSM